MKEGGKSMAEAKKKMQLSTKIFLAMVLGVPAGFLLGGYAAYLEFIGTIWLNMIRMFIVPIVVTLLVKGIASMESPETLGRIGFRVILFYMCTTVLAIFVGIFAVYLIQPGVGFQFEAGGKALQPAAFPGAAAFFTSLFSQNIFDSFSKATMMQVLIIAVLMGVALVFMEPEKRRPIVKWFSEMGDLFMAVIGLAMRVAPVGVFCLMAAAMGKYGVGFLGNMSLLLATFYLGCLIQFMGIYVLFLWTVTGIRPLDFIKRSMETLVTAISTCSSAATVPVNLMVAKEHFGVDESISNFSIPLGANMNQDGGAILSGVVMIFCAQAIGTEFDIGQLFNLIVLTTIVTSGSSGIPGGGIMRLIVVAAAMNLPLEIIGIVSAFYRLFDMGTTSMSVMGDLSATVVIDHWEKKRKERAALNAGG
jgi:Na+/H+-dicarboxylate symporter